MLITASFSYAVKCGCFSSATAGCANTKALLRWFREPTKQSRTMPCTTRLKCCALQICVEQTRLLSLGDRILDILSIFDTLSLKDLGVICHPTWWFRPLVVGLPRATQPRRRFSPISFYACKCSPTPPSGQALAESLKSNGSLEWLRLQSNNIGDRGAEALLAECLPTGVTGMNDSLGIAGLMWQEGWSFRGVGDVAIGQFLQRRASTYILGYLSWAVPCSRIFGFSGWAVGSDAKRWSQALAAGLLQNRSLRELWLSPFGSSLWLCVGSRGTPGRQAPAGGRSGRERRCAPQRWGATVRPSLGWNEMWIVCEMSSELDDSLFQMFQCSGSVDHNNSILVILNWNWTDTSALTECLHVLKCEQRLWR